MIPSGWGGALQRRSLRPRPHTAEEHRPVAGQVQPSKDDGLQARTVASRALLGRGRCTTCQAHADRARALLARCMRQLRARGAR
eukprot:2013446-Pyramimonas_sp.AAC.1